MKSEQKSRIYITMKSALRGLFSGRKSHESELPRLDASWLGEYKAVNANNSLFKVVVLGADAPGKSSLFMDRFVKDKFTLYTKSTIGADFGIKDVPLLDGTVAKLQIWDTASQDRFRTLNAFCRGTDAIVILVDLTRKETLQRSASLWKQVKNDITTKPGISICHTIVIANKLDLVDENEREITPEDLDQLCIEQGLDAWSEASAKDGTNINEIMSYLSHEMTASRRYLQKPSVPICVRQISYNNRLKVVVVGHNFVGKTSFLNRFVYGNFSDSVEITVQDSVHTKAFLLLARTVIKLQLWDTESSNNIFPHVKDVIKPKKDSPKTINQIQKPYWEDANGIIILVDLTKKKTLQEAIRVKQLIDKHLSEQGNSLTHCIVVANKSDLVEGREITRHDLDQMSRLLGFDAWCEVSAKDGTNVDDMMSYLCHEMLAKQRPILKPPVPECVTLISQEDAATGSSCVTTETQNDESKTVQNTIQNDISYLVSDMNPIKSDVFENNHLTQSATCSNSSTSVNIDNSGKVEVENLSKENLDVNNRCLCSDKGDNLTQAENLQDNVEDLASKESHSVPSNDSNINISDEIHDKHKISSTEIETMSSCKTKTEIEMSKVTSSVSLRENGTSPQSNETKKDNEMITSEVLKYLIINNERLGAYNNILTQNTFRLSDVSLLLEKVDELSQSVYALRTLNASSGYNAQQGQPQDKTSVENAQEGQPEDETSVENVIVGGDRDERSRLFDNIVRSSCDRAVSLRAGVEDNENTLEQLRQAMLQLATQHNSLAASGHDGDRHLTVNYNTSVFVNSLNVEKTGMVAIGTSARDTNIGQASSVAIDTTLRDTIVDQAGIVAVETTSNNTNVGRTGYMATDHSCINVNSGQVAEFLSDDNDDDDDDDDNNNDDSDSC